MITPIDVNQRTFTRVLRGYDPVEVQNFLEQISRQLEEMQRENNALQEQIRRHEESLSDYKRQEGALREALVAAGRLTDELREQAQKEADVVRAEANLQAEKILQSSHDELVRLSDECRALRQQKLRLISELNAVLEGHQRLMTSYEDEPEERAVKGRRKRGPSDDFFP